MSEVEKEMESDLSPPRNDITTTEEEDGPDAPTVIARCIKCGREMLTDGTQRGGNAFCKHQYMPVTVDQVQQQPHRRAESPVSSISSASAINTVRIPQTLQEAAALHEVQHNQFETQDYIKKFETDGATLGDTFDKCKNALEKEFAMLHDTLTKRKEELITELNQKYDERAQRIDDQATGLRNHNIKAEECKETCYRTMEEKQTREELPQRQTEVINECKNFINQRPIVKDIPISLDFRFTSQRDALRILTSYGRLDCRQVDSGKVIPWTEADTTINPILEDKNKSLSSSSSRQRQAQPLSSSSSNGHLNRGTTERHDRNLNERDRYDRNINNNNNNNYVNGVNEQKAESVDMNREEIDNTPPNAEHGEESSLKQLLVPSVRRIIVKCKDGQLRIEPVLKTPDFSDPNAVDEKEYEAYLKTNVFLQFECIGNQSRDKLSHEQYENGLIRHRDCLPVEPDKSGKITINIPNEPFENGMTVHARARFVYLDSPDYVRDGMVNNQDIVVSSDWSADKTVTFKANENHICTFEGGNSSANIINNNNNNNNNDLGFIPPPADQMENNSINNSMVNEMNSPGGNMVNMMGNIGGGGISTNEPSPVSSPPQLTHNKKRIKLKIDLQISGQKVQSKQFPFKDEFSFDSLLQKTRQRAKIPDGNFEFWLKNDPNIKISNNNEFIQYCVIPEPDDRGYNAHIVAQQV